VGDTVRIERRGLEQIEVSCHDKSVRMSVGGIYPSGPSKLSNYSNQIYNHFNLIFLTENVTNTCANRFSRQIVVFKMTGVFDIF
jgi:hypothetical protein